MLQEVIVSTTSDLTFSILSYIVHFVISPSPLFLAHKLIVLSSVDSLVGVQDSFVPSSISPADSPVAFILFKSV